MSKLKDLTGMKFGRLTVIKLAGKDKYGGKLWLCKCDCGNETVVAQTNLKRGKSQSCGCFRRDLRRESKIQDLTGQRFGKLTVIERAETKNRTVYWKCLCDCGNEIIVSTQSLRKGTSTSCGCLKNEDLTGKIFGRLTVIKRANTGNGNISWAYWLCRCSCGNEIVVKRCQLTSGNKKSCGCLTHERMIEDLTGQRFGRLVAIERAKSTDGHVCWLCECDCGNETIVTASQLKRGKTKSCGCLLASFKQCKEDLYNTWADIKKRCTNFNDKNYAGRGITMYPEWIDSLQNFYDYVSKLKNFGEPGYTLDRIDVNGNYEPDNLRWADNKTQGRNKQNNHLIQYEGEMITVTEVSERSGIATSTLLGRIKRGDTGERLFRPVENRGRSIKKSLR